METKLKILCLKNKWIILDFLSFKIVFAVKRSFHWDFIPCQWSFFFCFNNITNCLVWNIIVFKHCAWLSADTFAVGNTTVKPVLNVWWKESPMSYVWIAFKECTKEAGPAIYENVFVTLQKMEMDKFTTREN